MRIVETGASEAMAPAERLFCLYFWTAIRDASDKLLFVASKRRFPMTSFLECDVFYRIEGREYEMMPPPRRLIKPIFRSILRRIDVRHIPLRRKSGAFEIEAGECVFSCHVGYFPYDDMGVLEIGIDPLKAVYEVVDGRKRLKVADQLGGPFFFAALDEKGDEVRGTVKCQSFDEALSILRGKGLYPTRIHPMRIAKTK